MSQGFLRVQSFASRLSAPVGEVAVTVTGDGFTHSFVTDAEGNAPDLAIDAPDKRYSLDESSTVQPYSVCRLTASKTGWQGLVLDGVQIFDGQVTLAQLELSPADPEVAPLDVGEVVSIPPHSLYQAALGTGPQPALYCNSDSWVLAQVVIPSQITVHLGKPAASAQNVTVSFRHYIANVASSEVYPTWVGRKVHAVWPVRAALT